MKPLTTIILLACIGALAGCEKSIDRERQSVDDLECLTAHERYVAYWQNDTGAAMIANELRLIRGGGECPVRFTQETKQ